MNNQNDGNSKKTDKFLHVSKYIVINSYSHGFILTNTLKE